MRDSQAIYDAVAWAEQRRSKGYFQIVCVWAYYHLTFGPVMSSCYWESRGDSKSVGQACEHASGHKYPYSVYVYPVNEPEGRKRAEGEFAAWYEKRHGVAWNKNPNLAKGPWG